MKFNKKRKINKCEKYIEFVYENYEYCRVPLSYIDKITRTKGKIEEIKIKKSFLETIDKYMCQWSKRDKKDMQERFLLGEDITRIDLGNKVYYPNYIEQSWDMLGGHNILQEIKITEDVIIFCWDIDSINKVDCEYVEYEEWSVPSKIKLQISKRYEDIIFERYDEVKFV